jgi:hypothetical protein
MKYMKTGIYPFLLLSLAGGCIEDNGNYDYSTLDVIEIGGIKTDTTFQVDQFDTLRLTPALQFSGKEIADLSHEWKINHEVVSTEPALEVKVSLDPNTATAYYPASLRVTDNATGLMYYKNFRVTVTTSVTHGLFVLSELPDETATLSFQRRDRADAPFVHSLFEGANPTFGSLGKKPRMVYYKGLLGAQLGVLCSEGERKLSLLNPATLELTRGISEETIRGGYTGNFTPAALSLYMGGMIAGDGKLFGYNYMGNQAVYRPVVADSIVFADWAETNYTIDSYAWISYDNKGERFLQLEPGVDPLLYDRITPLAVEGGLSTAGQKFIAGGAYSTAVRAILYHPGERKAYSYGIDVVDELNMTTWEITITSTVNRFSTIENLIDEQSVCFYNTEYWYIANGGTVKRLHEKGTVPVDWFTAPRGEVTAMAVKTGSSAGGVNRLFIAVADGGKSFIHEVNLATGERLREPLEIDAKVVSLLAKGTWRY